MEVAEKKEILKDYQIMMNRYTELNRVTLPAIRYGEPIIENPTGFNPHLNRIDEKVYLEKKLAFIQKAVQKVEDMKERYILSYLYIDGFSLSDVSRKGLMNYERSWLARLRDKAIEHVDLDGYEELG